MKTCPSISLQNLCFTTVKIFPQQGNVSERRHRSTSHLRLAFLLSLIPRPWYPCSSPYDINLHFHLCLCLSLSISSSSPSTCASHRPLLLSLLKAKKSQILLLNHSYFNGKQLHIKSGDGEEEGGNVGAGIDGLKGKKHTADMWLLAYGLWKKGWAEDW